MWPFGNKRKYTVRRPGKPQAFAPYYEASPVPPNLEVDMRPSCPAVYDQRQLGSCTGNGWAAFYEFMKPGMTPSRLDIYYYERQHMGSQYTWQDSGAQVSDGAFVLNTRGVCDEKNWTYSDDPIKFRIKPPYWDDSQAKASSKINPLAVSINANDMKHCLMMGKPIVIGFDVYDSFESQQVAQNGIVPMPVSGEQMLGGHCVMIVGCSDSNGWWICRNSWGTSWGDKGYFYMPYAYLTDPNLASDFWTGSLV